MVHAFLTQVSFSIKLKKHVVYSAKTQDDILKGLNPN